MNNKAMASVAAKLRRMPKLDVFKEPVAPGWYLWDIWRARVEVFKRGRTLYICPPGGTDVKVTANLAGVLTPVPPA